MSLGRSLEIVKDLGDATTVANEYGLDRFLGTHAIGHARMATESDVDIANAHPYWAYPFPDVAVVHNGQLTNFHDWRRRLQRSGHRFQSDCDSEIIAVYLAQQMSEGRSLEEAMRQSLEDLDGVFTYICVTEDSLGVAKDELGAKPLVLYEDDELVALASEEIAIRQVLDREIETHDPYEGEVRVWSSVSAESTARMDERGLVELDDSIPKTSKIDGISAVFDAADLTTRKINAELRWLIYEQGVTDVTVLRRRAHGIRSGSRSWPAAGSASRAASATSAAA